MTTECNVRTVGFEQGQCVTATLERLSRMLVVIGILALVLIAGVALVSSLSTETGSVANVGEELSSIASGELTIGDASDPVQYTSLVRQTAAGREISASPLDGPEFYVALARSRSVPAVANVSSDLLPADGPEFYVAQARSGSAPAVADVSSDLSPADGPEFYVAQARSGSAPAVADVSSDLSPAAGPEFFFAQARSGSALAVAVASTSPQFYDSGAHREIARAVADASSSPQYNDSGVYWESAPAIADASSSPQFYDSGVWADVTACTTWSDALALFQGAKSVEDPVNGALSAAQAEFDVAKHGAAGAVC